MQHDKASLDIFWLKDESLEDSDNLPKPEILEAEIVESLETALVVAADIPWADIAFPSTRYALDRYLEDREAGVERHHLTELTRRMAE